MKLFYSPGACSLSPHVVLSELVPPHQLVKVSTKTKKTEDGGDHYQANAKGYVPTLELDDGEPLTEGPATARVAARQRVQQALKAEGLA